MWGILSSSFTPRSFLLMLCNFIVNIGDRLSEYLYILFKCPLGMSVVHEHIVDKDRRGRVRMVVGFTTIYAIGPYHHILHQ